MQILKNKIIYKLTNLLDQILLNLIKQDWLQILNGKNKTNHKKKMILLFLLLIQIANHKVVQSIHRATKIVAQVMKALVHHLIHQTIHLNSQHKMTI